MAECSTDSDCTNEKCVAWHQLNDMGLAKDVVKFCGHADACRIVGRVNNLPFSTQCTDTEAEPPLLTPGLDVEALEAMITPPDVNWDDAKNLKIMAWDNYMTGWWIRDEEAAADGIVTYTESDKPVINTCETTDDCDTELGQCCSYWPASNNKRCIDASSADIETLIPLNT